MKMLLNMLNQIIGGLLIAAIVWFSVKYFVERRGKNEPRK